MECPGENSFTLAAKFALHGAHGLGWTIIGPVS
jgi:hypothetical protein